MSHHRNWMYRDGCESSNYAKNFIKGVEEFLDFAFSHPECVADGMIRCPSSKCDFSIFKTRECVRICLLNYGFVPDYKRWSKHGESNIEMENINTEDERNENWASEMLREAAGPNCDPYNENPNAQSKKFFDSFESCNEPLWNGCDSYTKLTAGVYAKELRQVNGLNPETPVNAVLNPGCDPVLDPGYKTWEVAVGGVQKGRLFGRPGEKWKKGSGNASSVDYAAYVASQNSSEKMKTIEKKMAAQEAYINNMAPFLAELAQRFGMRDSSSSTPITDGASNIPTVESPFDNNGEMGDDIP